MDCTDAKMVVPLHPDFFSILRMKKIVMTGLCMLLGAVVSADNIHEVSLESVNDTSRVIDLDEVVVIAQPKEGALLRHQPMSSSAFGTQEMQLLQMKSLGQLADYVPSFVMPEYGSRLTSSMYIRGIGSRVNNSAVGIYYDHIPLMSKSAFNTHFYMLDRVDVLRGPQGTLYGANSEGGIVRIYSKNPMSYQGTDVNIGAATSEAYKAEVAHYHRPSENLAFMVAGFFNGQRGFFKNPNVGEYNDKMKEAGAKARLVWKPANKLTFDLTSDYQFTIQNGFPYGAYNADKDETAEPSTTFMNTYRRQMVNTGLTISYDFDDYLLTSTTSHQYLWDRMKMDQDYVVADYMGLQQQQKMNAVTQELVFRSKNASRWQHTSGLFGSYQWLHTDAPVYFGDTMGSFIMSQWGMPAAATSMMAFQNNWVSGDFRTPQLNFGAYHESNVMVTDRLKLTLGLRYDYSQVKIDYNTKAMFDLAVKMGPTSSVHSYLSEIDSDQKHSYHQVLPKVALTYTLCENGSNVYAVVSKGFRAGGYNLQMFSDIFQTEERGLGKKLMALASADYTVAHTSEQIDKINETISYKPEESWNYEAGTHLSLFDGKVKADAAFFFTQIRNQQLSVMAGTYGYGRMMVNAGKSYSCGAELALRGRAFDDHLSWGATYSFTHAVFKEYTDSVATATGYEAISYKDKYVPFIPQHQFSVNGDYRFDVNDEILNSITVGFNVKGQGKTYWEADNEICQKFYATLGAHLMFKMNNVEVDFWGRNLTDTKYHTFLVNSQLTKQYFAQLGNPLQAGVDLRLHF